MSSGFFRGTNTEQDSRWGDAEKKLLRRTKFSKVLEQKVNMKKVNMDVMQRWIAQRITSLLGFEDDIVVGTCVNYLAEEGKLDPKKLQLQLTGFLEKSTGMFMEELWGLLVDAQSSLGGIPSAFLQDKKQEIIQAKEEESKKEEELQRRMAEHRQEMERAALLAQADVSAASGGGSGSTSETLPRRRTADGRRASRWGVSKADVAATSAAGVMTENTDAPAAGDAESALLGSTSLSGPDPVAHKVDDAPPQDSRAGDMRERSPSDRSESPEKSRKHSKSDRDDDDEDGRKEKKRKSKSKHGKKSDRKKRKSGRRSEDREHRRSTKKSDERAASADGSGDEGTSSEDDEGAKSAVDMEEALRLKVLA
ncbi:unnamed protein product, partial [Laminaria digitata]